jgi:hypothetical protein
MKGTPVSHPAPPRRRGIRSLASVLATLLTAATMLVGAAAPASAADDPDRFGIPEYIDVETGSLVHAMIVPDSPDWDGTLIDYPLAPGLDLRPLGVRGMQLVGTAPPPGAYQIRVSGILAADLSYREFRVTVRSAQPVAWTEPTLPQAEVGSAYDLALSDARAWETFSTTDALPPGLDLTADGRLVGTPTGYGTFRFTVTAQRTDLSSQHTFELRVTQGAAPVWSTAALPRLQVGASANIQLAVSDTTSLALVSGALPAGLSISGTTLTGTPTTAEPYDFTLAADGPGGTTNRTFSGFVRLPAVVWGTPAELSFPRGAPVDLRLQATNATEFDVWAGELPAGLTLDADGRLHGTPTRAGTTEVALVAGHRDGAATQRFTIEVTAPAAELLFDGWPFEGWPAPVEAEASGLAPGSEWQLTLLPSGATVASGRADASGVAFVDDELDVPVPFGAHELRFTATAADGSPVTDSVWFSVGADGEIVELSLTGPVAEPPRAVAPIPVQAPAAASDAGALPQRLPATGAEPLTVLAWVGLLLAGGTAAVVLAAAGSVRRSRS